MRARKTAYQKKVLRAAGQPVRQQKALASLTKRVRRITRRKAWLTSLFTRGRR